MRTPKHVHCALPDVFACRMANHIERAFHGAYGARTTLRTLARSVARHMLVAGVPAQSVATTLERCVLDHPACMAADPRNVLTGERLSVILVQVMRECVDEVAAQMPLRGKAIGVAAHG